ncbi:hypothetical protein LTS00_011499 [Friedmanniomyces endolithicus]|uniref:Dynamin N-terminal domain-containing protein n=1 Tax=Friedmanniomyces endolithicus TaxID=329885 RepID=A0AAN6JF38_9PEZI|nr:hypothetical protein LTS00_011499 [Friedmanniomyces endolithicus]KAK0327409.1 hypothetical protein LTR82_000923 [Friedmanniomyces endolithicus]
MPRVFLTVPTYWLPSRLNGLPRKAAACVFVGPHRTSRQVWYPAMCTKVYCAGMGTATDEHFMESQRKSKRCLRRDRVSSAAGVFAHEVMRPPTLSRVKDYLSALKKSAMGSTGTDSLPVSGDDGGQVSVHHVAVPKTIGSSSLDALQSTDSRRVMDIVDKLRRSGLSGILQLPQLVVSGDQSSGKSSVLEAITEIPFPRKENLCTRFATEIILRRATTTSINTKIIPDKQRPTPEHREEAPRAIQEHHRGFH